jgi:uncharacterized protein
MLLDFEVENFRSYRDLKRFSLVASSAKELPENVIELSDPDFSLLSTAAIYGPNASGKSNLFLAMNCLSELMEFPRNKGLTSRLAMSPFALDLTSAAVPSKFRVRFLLEGVLYDYSISIRPGLVEEERLVAYPHGRPQEWVLRKGPEIDFNSTHLRGQKQPLRSMTPLETPVLSVASMFDHAQLSPPARWMANNLCDHFDAQDFGSRFARRRTGGWGITARRCLEDVAFRSWVNGFLAHADLGIQGVEIEVTEEKSRRPVRQVSPDGTVLTSAEDVTHRHHEPYFVHHGDEGMTARFGLPDESQGTRRLFGMLVPLYETLRDGRLALVDELSASLHPTLVRELIRAFHDRQLNPKRAQLVFATHDTSLLSGSFFRRDQVWFTEKNPAGATDLYSLQDIRDVRPDEPFEKGYVRGRYGAIPFFGQFDFPPASEELSETTT